MEKKHAFPLEYGRCENNDAEVVRAGAPAVLSP